MPRVPAVIARGWPVVLEMAATVAAPPEVVWRLVTDWERQGDWMLEASDFVVTSPHREGVGVEAEATIRIGGIETRDRIRVSVWDPPRRLVIDHLGWVTGHGEIYLARSGPGRSRAFWREELHPPLGLLGALGLIAFKPLMRRIFERDIEVLRDLSARAAGALESPPNHYQ
ncbi:MAG: SRPBCC family protein [Actinobacteria bacterium]|nr:SRPBCC family protein [Actinomycetota bacterium]